MKIHIIGIAGSGKTTLARWLGDRFDVRAFDLDFVVYDSSQASGRRPRAGAALTRSGVWTAG